MYFIVQGRQYDIIYYTTAVYGLLLNLSNMVIIHLLGQSHKWSIFQEIVGDLKGTWFNVDIKTSQAN